MSYPPLIEQAIEHLNKLPGVGRRSAERVAFWLLDADLEKVEALAESLVNLKKGLGFCRECNHLTDQDVCSICRDTNRDVSLLCVVEDPKDVIAIERSGSFRGKYHVLLGTLSPTQGQGPRDIKVDHLIKRVRAGGVTEVILATDADSDGELTAAYLADLIKPLGIAVTRIGVGLPVGGSVEYADLSSLSMSMSGRRTVS